MLILQGWTLSFELYFYLMFSVLLLIASERTAPFILSIWAVAIVSSSLLMPTNSDAVLNTITSPLALEFLAGCLIFRIYDKVNLSPGAGLLLIAFSFAWIAAVVGWAYYAHGGSQLWIQGSRWIRPATYGGFAALFVLGLMSLERSSVIHFSQPVVAVGDWSYSIYLLHLGVVETVGRLTAHCASHLPFAISIVYAVSIPLILCLGYISYNWLEAPLIAMLYKHRAGSSLKEVSSRTG